jgi:uncharacterized small protein (DUF1192 family)
MQDLERFADSDNPNIENFFTNLQELSSLIDVFLNSPSMGSYSEINQRLGILQSDAAQLPASIYDLDNRGDTMESLTYEIQMIMETLRTL